MLGRLLGAVLGLWKLEDAPRTWGDADAALHV